MTERERLIELLTQLSRDRSGYCGFVADYLVENGVRLPVTCGECKNYDSETEWCEIHSCFINSNGDFCHPWESSEWKMFDRAYYCADGERRA